MGTSRKSDLYPKTQLNWEKKVMNCLQVKGERRYQRLLFTCQEIYNRGGHTLHNKRRPVRESRNRKTNTKPTWIKRNSTSINPKRLGELRHLNTESGLRPSKVGKTEVYKNYVIRRGRSWNHWSLCHKVTVKYNRVFEVSKKKFRQKKVRKSNLLKTTRQKFKWLKG